MSTQSLLWLLGVTDDAGPVEDAIRLRAQRQGTDAEVVAALEQALAAARARVAAAS